MHLQLVLSPEFSSPILPSCSLRSLVEVPEASALKKRGKKKIDVIFWGHACRVGVLLLAESYLSDTRMEKWCREDQRGLERACVLECASFHAAHENELCVFESFLAGEKIGLWSSFPVEETTSLSR